MKNRWIFTAILAIAICFSLLPAPAQAAAVMKTGTCGDQGDNLTWTLDDTGLLTISGTGEMAEYDRGDARWFPYREQINAVVIEDGVTSITEQAFSGCTYIKSVSIADSVTAIGHYAFYNCSSLESIEIPDSVTDLGSHVFYGCSSMTSANIPNAIINLWEFTFYGCSSLTTMIIPDSVLNIGECAFAECTSLESVVVPKNMIRIGWQAFYNCSRLWHVFYKGTEEDWEKMQIKAEQNEFHWAGRHYNCNGTETVDTENNTCIICTSRCEHNWNTGTVTKEPTVTEEGVLTYTCIECNATKTEPIAVLAEPPADGENPIEPTGAAPSQDCDTADWLIPWWWLAVVAGICLVSNVIFVVIILKKKK